MTISLDPATPADRTPLLDLAVATGLFAPADAKALLGGVLDALFAGSLSPGSAALVARLSPSEPPVGWTYVAPDAHADGVWNVWWIGVTPAAHGAGAGVALLRAAESAAMTGGGRLMIIETSALPSQARARHFYVREGYTEGGRIPDFYGAGDDKVILFRQLRRE
jgi:ribosomal protein S18 acetylase RimI-like enzyme